MENPKKMKLFGFPLVGGRVKKRVARKYLNRRFPWWREAVKLFGNLGVGDLVNDCSAFNVVITELEPDYSSIGSSYRRYGRVCRGFVLRDVDIYSARNSASLRNCGVTLPKSYEDLKKDWEERIVFYEKEGDQWGFAKRYRSGTLNPDGTFTPAPKEGEGREDCV